MRFDPHAHLTRRSKREVTSKASRGSWLAESPKRLSRSDS